MPIVPLTSCAGKTPDEIRAMKDRGELDVRLSLADFQDAVKRIQPSVSLSDCDKYEKCSSEFGSV